MNALHPVMAQALRGICPPAAPSAQDQLDSLLRAPFTIEVQTRAAITNCEPDFCSEAEYAEVEVPQHLVAQAVDWLMDKHWRELEAKVEELMAKEWLA